MRGEQYIKWFSEEDKIRYMNQFHLQNSEWTDNKKHEFLNDRYFEDLFNFLSLSFVFASTKGGHNFWIDFWIKYNDSEKLNIKPPDGFRIFKNRPKILK